MTTDKLRVVSRWIIAFAWGCVIAGLVWADMPWGIKLWNWIFLLGGLKPVQDWFEKHSHPIHGRRKGDPQ